MASDCGDDFALLDDYDLKQILEDTFNDMQSGQAFVIPSGESDHASDNDVDIGSYNVHVPFENYSFREIGNFTKVKGKKLPNSAKADMATTESKKLLNTAKSKFTVYESKTQAGKGNSTATEGQKPVSTITTKNLGYDDTSESHEEEDTSDEEAGEKSKLIKRESIRLLAESSDSDSQIPEKASKSRKLKVGRSRKLNEESYQEFKANKNHNSSKKTGTIKVLSKKAFEPEGRGLPLRLKDMLRMNPSDAVKNTVTRNELKNFQSCIKKS